MIRGRNLLFVAGMAFLFLAPFQCRNAAGENEDPMDREAVRDLVDYLKINTSNPPGNETQAALFLQRLLAKEGIQAQLIGSDPGRQSVYAVLKSGTSEKALLLMHHLDVVPADRSEWTVDPFSGAQNGGYIWGRGALDIKSLGVAELMAFIELKRKNAPLARDVILFGVADEEAGGLHGCKEILEQHPELFRNTGYVLNEGGDNETIVDKVKFWSIEVSQKVPLWVRLTSHGPAGHAASPPVGGGSIASLVSALSAIERIPTPYRVVPAVARYLEAIGKLKNDARGEVLRNIDTAIATGRIDKVLSPGYRSILRNTIALTHISGGAAVNAIPAHATADVDIRLLPDESVDDMLRKINEAVGNDAKVDVLVRGEPAPESPGDTPLFESTSRAMRASAPGSTVVPMVGTGTSDSRFFRARGIVAYGIAPFKVNYYDADTVHGPDERIRTRFFTEGVHLMRNIVSDFCVKK